MARLYLPHVGGVEKHIFKLTELLKAKYDITVVCHKHHPSLPDFEILNGITVYRLPSVNKWSVWLWFIRHYSLLINAKIIHIHDVFYWYLPFIFLTKKTYITFHGYEGSEAPNLKQILWHRLAAKLTRGNICIGGFHQKYYGVKPDFVSYGAA